MKLVIHNPSWLSGPDRAELLGVNASALRAETQDFTGFSVIDGLLSSRFSPMPAAGIRQVEEAVGLIKPTWKEPCISFRGNHVRAEGAVPNLN